MIIPEKINFRGKRYSKYSVHNKKNIALREAEKVRIEGHLATVKTIFQKHIVYINKKKIVPYPELKRDIYRIVDGQRFDMVTFSWNKKNAKQYAIEQKGGLFNNYRIFKEKIKYGKYKGRKRYVIYGKK
jgi:hypothetical protein